MEPSQQSQSSAQATAIFDGWDQLSWKERRARRVQRWLEPAGVEFASDSARDGYHERVRILMDALELRVPTRIPLFPMLGLYTTSYAGLTAREAMFDYPAGEAAWAKFHEDFLPDYQGDPALPGPVLERVGATFVKWPGHGIADEQSWQYVEAEYMAAEDYDALIADPSAFFMRSYLPRIASAFAPLATLDPFSDMIEPAGFPYGLIPFADPEVIAGVRRLADAGEAMLDFLDSVKRRTTDVVSRLGLPAPWGGMVKAPYDILADTLRGTRGIAVDRYRRPEKIVGAMERLVPLQIDAGIRQMALSESPIVFIPLHKGADGFMSDADFREMYWPPLKSVLSGLIDEGIVPLLFAEGGFNDRLEAIADDDLPTGSVIWWFDATDMAAARDALRNRACIAGNVPGSLLAVGAPEDVERYVVGLLDDVAGEGGFVLGSGVVVDDARPEVLKAMIESGRRWSA